MGLFGSGSSPESYGGGGSSSGDGLAGSWGRSGYDPSSMGIQSGLSSSPSGGAESDGGGLAGMWGATGYDPTSMGVLSGLAGPSTPGGYASSYLGTLGAGQVAQEHGLTTYADSRGNVYSFNPTSGKIDQIGAPSMAGGVMTTARGYQTGRQKTGRLADVALSSAFPETYRDALYEREQGTRERYTQETLPNLQRQIDEQYQLTLEDEGLSAAITERGKALGLLSQGKAAELAELGFDVSGMRDLPGKGALGRMASQLGFDVDEYAIPETTLAELISSGAVEYDPETGRYEETGKLGMMAGGTFLSALTGTPGLARLAYGLTESIPAALGTQKAASLAGGYLSGQKAPVSSSLKQSIVGAGVKYGAPQFSQLVGVAQKGGPGFLGMADYASSLQAAGIRPRGDFYADPVSGVYEGDNVDYEPTLAEFAYADGDSMLSNYYGSSFYTNPYGGNLATYYKMFAPYTV